MNTISDRRLRLLVEMTRNTLVGQPNYQLGIDLLSALEELERRREEEREDKT